MSEWSERFRNASVWGVLEAFGPALDNAEKREALDPAALESLARLRTALSFIGRRLATADPALALPGPLDNIASQIQNSSSEVQSFVSNGNPGHLANANGSMDSALSYLPSLITPSTPSDLQALKDAADRYRDALETNTKRAERTINTLERSAEDVATRFAELANDVSSERQRLSSLASDFQSQFSAAQESRNIEYGNAQTSRQEKFADLLATSTDSMAKQEQLLKGERERLTQDHDSAVGEMRDTFEKKAADLLATIEQHRSDVERLVGVIGNLGLTSGYLKTANEAKSTVRVWQGIAVASMVALIVVAYLTFLPVVKGTFTWESFAGRVFFTLTVGVLAAYAASQADRYHSVERRNRALALELEALGPFLAPLPDDKQESFRLTIGDRTFGHAESPEQFGKSPATAIDVLMRSKEFRALLTDVLKAIRSS